MAKRFPLLLLPPDALRKVCVLMDPMELIELSFLSTKTKNMLKTLLIVPKNYDIKYTKDKKTIKFEFLNGKKIGWKFESNLNINEILERRTFSVRDDVMIHKLSLKIRKSASGMTIYPSPSFTEEFLMLFFFTHFLQIFPGEVSSLQLEIFQMVPKNWFLTQVSARRLFCETLDILGVPDIPNVSMALENIAAQQKIRIEPEMPGEYQVPQVGPFSSVTRMFLKNRRNGYKEEGITVPKEFELLWKFGSEHFIQNLTIPHLIIANGSWVSIHNLKRINSRCCRVKGSKYSLEDIHHYIRSFLEFGTGLDVEWLTVDVDWRELDQWDMMKCFETKKWNPEQRDGYFSQFQGNVLMDIDCREGLDVERADGIMATGIYEPHQGSPSKFHFIVWRTRFPNMENVIRGREMLVEMERRDERNRWRIEENGRRRLDNYRKVDSLRDEIQHMREETKKELAVNMRELDDYALNVKRLTDSLQEL